MLLLSILFLLSMKEYWEIKNQSGLNRWMFYLLLARQKEAQEGDS
jgi:hypothetical protein